MEPQKNPNEFVLVCRCSNSLEAGIVRGFLENQGIQVRLADDHAQHASPGATVKKAGVLIMVLRKDLPLAKELLDEVNQDDAQPKG